MKNYDVDKNEIYLEKISNIIERLENNHFKWMTMLVSTILAMTTIMSTLLLNSDYTLRIVSLVATFIPFFIIQCTSFYQSNLYLLMGRCFRELESKPNENSFNWKAEISTKTKKWGFIQRIGLIMIFVSIGIFISLLTASILI